MTDRARLIGEIIESLHAVRHKFVPDSRSFSDANQITFSQLVVLRIISRHDGIGIKELAGNLGITSSAATQLVDGLDKKDYLKREGSSEDRRALKIGLSDKGKEKIDSLRTQNLKKLFSVFEVLDDDELVEYCDLNKKIADKLLGR
jgi:DNA-binding MarR family transcriptional regulator